MVVMKTGLSRILLFISVLDGEFMTNKLGAFLFSTKTARPSCIHSESIDKRIEKRYLRHMIFRCPDGGK